jgi:hypothetical protein
VYTRMVHIVGHRILVLQDSGWEIAAGEHSQPGRGRIGSDAVGTCFPVGNLDTN